MTPEAMKLRKLCSIEEVSQSRDMDHDVETVYVICEDLPGTQGFGGCMRDVAESKLFLREICDAFSVRDPEALVGLQAVALYTEEYGDIEGLEDPVTGKRFTKYGFALRHHPDKAETPNQHKVASVQSEIRWLKRRLEEEHKKLAHLIEHPVVNWETEP